MDQVHILKRTKDQIRAAQCMMLSTFVDLRRDTEFVKPNPLLPLMHAVRECENVMQSIATDIEYTLNKLTKKEEIIKDDTKTQNQDQNI